MHSKWGKNWGQCNYMKTNPQKHHRRSIRLRGYDYSQPGWYFVTICTQNHTILLGQIENGKMQCNEAGKIVQKYWLEIPNQYPNVVLDEFMVMPNHLRGIIHIIVANHVGAENFPPLRENLPKNNKNGQFMNCPNKKFIKKQNWKIH